MAKTHKMGFPQTDRVFMKKNSNKSRINDSIEVFLKIVESNKNPNINDLISAGIDGKSAKIFLNTYHQTVNKFDKGEL